MAVIGKVKRIMDLMRSLKTIYKDGGVNQVKLTTIKYGNILDNKKIVITGAGSGIGLAIAQKCISCGAQVVITGRNEDKLKAAIVKINSPKIKYIVWDVSDVSLLSSKIDECMLKLDGSIDIFINNAGAAAKEFFPNVSEIEWDRIYNTNSKAIFFISEYLCKYWMRNPADFYRKIINIDSQGGFVGATYPYRMSKWDIRGLTKGLGLKMAPHNVLVNGIAPGVVKTEMQKFSMQQGDNMYCSQNPLKRICLPEEVAELAVFMISDSCNFMVGETVLLDGGYSLI